MSFVTDRQENEHLKSEVARWTYLVIIILWIIFGMGYIYAVVDVISGTLAATRFSLSCMCIIHE